MRILSNVRWKACKQEASEHEENEMVSAYLMRLENLLGLLVLLALATAAGAQQATTHGMVGYISCPPRSTGIGLLPSPGAKPIATIACGDKIMILEEPRGEDWAKIETSGGNVGYVWRGAVSLDSPEAQAQSRSIDYAIQATSDIRNSMLDPTSFTVLEVIAATKQEKDGRTSFKGCVRYVGSNIVGGRLQRWGNYSVNKNGQLKSSAGNQYSGCYIGKNDVQVDMTVEVKKAISQEDEP
jgi:hypothetical protein